MYEGLKKYSEKFTRQQLMMLATCLFKLPDAEGTVACWCRGIFDARSGQHKAPYTFGGSQRMLDAWGEGHKQFLYAPGMLEIEERDHNAD